MIVIDVFDVVELLQNRKGAGRVLERTLFPEESLRALHLLDVKVLQLLRRYTRAGELTVAS